MPLNTVRVPAALAPVFESAERIVSQYFQQRKDDPAHGTIEIAGERYVLVRAASLSVEFFAMVGELYGAGREAEAADFARNILFDLAHGIGKSDAKNFHTKMGVSDPIARLSAGPVHFAHTGWAFVDISPESRPAPGAGFYLLYDHPYSFESDAWLSSDHRPDFPVCIMNAGYSSGWCEESFGMQLVASEVLCRAKGDDCCRFIMAQPDRIEEYVQHYIQSKPQLEPRMRLYQIPDFFARKRLEEELRRGRSELERRVDERTAELSTTNAQLVREIAEREEVERRLRQSQKLEAVGRLAGGIAHDFNNLLTAVSGYAEMALLELDTHDELRLYLDEIRRATDRAGTLTQQLLAFSRQQVLSPAVIDLDALVANLANMLRRLIGEHIELAVESQPGLWRVRADPGQIEQVIVNLAVNARDSMPRGGTLTLRTANIEPGALAAYGVTGGATGGATGLSESRCVMLSVGDTGEGMDGETQAHIFEPFFTTKERGKGTGLGLPTVYGIVQQSRGAISVTSSPGAGSIFRIFLPMVEEEVSEPAPSVPAALQPSRGGTILLVEDEPSVRDLARRALERAGYSVIVASDPMEAIEKSRALDQNIDLLLSDVVMPRLSGVELAKQLMSERVGMRVLFMSGHAAESVGDASLSRGGAAFLQKPYRFEELLAKVRELLG